jgi:predicted phage tail protein
MLRTLHLRGDLEQRFGGPYQIDVSSAREAGRFCAVMLPGFREHVHDKLYRIVVGDPETGFEIGEDELSFQLGRGDIYIIPQVLGAGGNSKGIAKLVVGVALIAVASAFSFGAAAGFATPVIAGSTGALASVTWGGVATLGLALSLAGVSMLLSPSPRADYGDREDPDQRASFLFNGPVNNVEQGGPVPLCYGRVMTGGTVVSASLQVEQIP